MTQTPNNQIRYIARVQSQAEADEFCKIADKLGYKWRDGSSSVGNTEYWENRPIVGYWLDTEYGTNKHLVCCLPICRFDNEIKRGECKIASINEYFKEFMKENKNFKMFARRFEDTPERIEAIREFVTDNITVGVDYADKGNPVIKLYNEGENEPFVVGNVGDYVVNDNGTFRIMSDAAEMTDVMLNQK